MSEDKDLSLTLSDQAQLCVVELFQKALVTMKDVSSILANLTFKVDSLNHELVVMNPETCKLTDDDLVEGELQTLARKDFKNRA